MVREENDDKLTETDRELLRLYDEAKEPVEWDASDDAILAYASEIHRKKGAEIATPAAAGGQGDDGVDGDLEGDNVVSFERHRRSFVHRVIHSPAMGFSLAASLMIGVFAGQGIIPYVDLGVSPGYDKVVQDNERLREELSQNRSLLTRSLKTSGETPAADSGSLLQLTQALSGFDCASLSATLSKDMEITVSGFVSSEADLQRLTGKLAPLDRMANVVNRAAVRAWPTCAVMDILYTKTGFHTPRAEPPLVRPLGHGRQFVESEKLVVEAEATKEYDGYLYVDFIQHDGTVLHMLPGPDMPDNAVKAGQRVLLGNGLQEYTIAAPFGEEMLVVLSSPEPLFDKPRPQTEKAEDYLDALRAALARADKQGFGDKIVSNFDFIETSPKGAGSGKTK